MRIEVFADPATLATGAAAFLATEIGSALQARGRCTLAASGGRTPWTMYAALATHELAWDRVCLAQVDERIAPAGHPQRNLIGLQAAFSAVAAHLQWLPMPVEADDVHAAARAYARELARVAGDPPHIDLVHLGLGDDGHTASLLPADAALDADTDVAITSGLREGMRRMTLSFAALNRARRIVWVIAGADKTPMLRRMLNADRTIPAGCVSQANAVLLCDRAAAADLSATGGA